MWQLTLQAIARGRSVRPIRKLFGLLLEALQSPAFLAQHFKLAVLVAQHADLHAQLGGRHPLDRPKDGERGQAHDKNQFFHRVASLNFMDWGWQIGKRLICRTALKKVSTTF